MSRTKTIILLSPCDCMLSFNSEEKLAFDTDIPYPLKMREDNGHENSSEKSIDQCLVVRSVMFDYLSNPIEIRIGSHLLFVCSHSRSLRLTESLAAIPTDFFYTNCSYEPNTSHVSPMPFLSFALRLLCMACCLLVSVSSSIVSTVFDRFPCSLDIAHDRASGRLRKSKRSGGD